MGSIELGAKQAIINCLKVERGERVVVITDVETRKIADALVDEAKRAGGLVQIFVMEDFGTRPDDGKNPLKFPKEIAEAISRAQVGIYAADGKPGEFASFRGPMFNSINENLQLRHGHMPGVTEEIMCQGMSTDHSKIQALSKKVFDIVSLAKEIRVTTSAGADFSTRHDSRHRWVLSDGNIKPGKWGNLPGAEVYTAPVDANGSVVIDGCLGDYFTTKYGDILKTPVSLKLESGRCAQGSISCANAMLKEEFGNYLFNTDENSNRVGELGIGTNIGLTRLIGNLLQDEKFPGVHIAFGEPHSDKTGADWTSTVHCDGVMRNPTIVVDGKTIMENGKFAI